MRLNSKIIIKTIGTKILMLQWPEQINVITNKEIVCFNHFLKTKFSRIMTDSVPAYNSLTLYFKENIDLSRVESKIIELIDIDIDAIAVHPQTWCLPVCYDLEFGLDLNNISKLKNKSIEEIIELHCQPLYHVYFIGFLPGFLYLGGLSKKLQTPRLTSPRAVIPKGSVGIGGIQTGVYPSASPGGWNLIGQTPVELFDMSQSWPTFIQSGDKVKFKSISIEKFFQLKEQIKNKTFNSEELKID